MRRVEDGSQHTWGLGGRRLEGKLEEGEPAGNASLFFYRGLGVGEIMPSVVSWRGRGTRKRGDMDGETREEGGAMNKVMFSKETVVGRYHSESRVHSLGAM